MSREQQALALADEVGADAECITWDDGDAIIEEGEEPGWRCDEWHSVLTIEHGSFKAVVDFIDGDVRKTARRLLAALAAFNREVSP